MKQFSDKDTLDLECAVFEHMMAQKGANEDSVNATIGWMRSNPELFVHYLEEAKMTGSVQISCFSGEFRV